LLGFAAACLVACEQNMAQDKRSAPRRDINDVLIAHDKELLALPDVVGVYVGTLSDGRTRCLKVMLAHENTGTQRKIPKRIEGYRVIVQATGEPRGMQNH
jgi:hypothetical protein